MLKAILYYILFLAEYLITIFLGGFLVGLYMAMNMDSGSHSQQIGALKESVYPFIIVIGFLTPFIPTRNALAAPNLRNISKRIGI